MPVGRLFAGASVPIGKLAKRAWHFSQRLHEPQRSLHALRQQMASRPANVPGRANVLGWDLEYVDGMSLVDMVNWLVFKQYNDFVSTSDKPVIVDCGSNIGISVLRFKQLYPDAQITAFEPDHEICEVLRRNVARNNATDVDVVEAAIWREAGSLTFSRDQVESGHLIHDSNARASGSVSTVKTVWLGDYLQTPVDFLKLDIEGAELPVLESCAHLLRNVQKAIIEVHYMVDQPESLGTILCILGQAGFKTALHVSLGEINLQRTPYVRPVNLKYDQYHVLYAWRE
jgi:FkbM family methyltransferase